MRRLLHTLTIAAIALSLAGCSSGPAQQPTTTPSSSTAQPSTPENEVAGQSANSPDSGSSKADQLCASQSESSDAEVCVLTGLAVDGNLTFESFTVLKLIDMTIDGSLDATASQEIVITNATVNGNVALSSGGGAVVKDSDINGNISVNNARNLTFVDNAVNGNVECLVSNTHGSRNSITGDVSGDCTELR